MPGKIGWDDKVIDRLPGFQMYDPWVTREMTIRDLLVHRSGLGLGAGDLLFVPRTNLTRAESVRRLRYIKPATSFRSGYAYDNVLYMVAGQLIEAVTGQTWEKFTAEHVLKPAGMLHSTTDERRALRQPRTAPSRMRAWTAACAAPATQEPLDERDDLGRTAAPAGGLADQRQRHGALAAASSSPTASCRSTAGACSARRRTSEMWTPVTLQPIGPLPGPLTATQPKFNTYALGWDITRLPRRQDRLARRRGVRLPDRRGADPRQACRLRDRDQQRGRRDHRRPDVRAARPLPRRCRTTDWPAKFVAFKTAQGRRGAARRYKADAAKPAKVGPSLPLAELRRHLSPIPGTATSRSRSATAS